MTMFTELIEERTQALVPAMVDDPVQDRLLDIIAEKKKGKHTAKMAKPEPAPASNVINIMDALRKSIASEGKPGRR